MMPGFALKHDLIQFKLRSKEPLPGITLRPDRQSMERHAHESNLGVSGHIRIVVRASILLRVTNARRLSNLLVR